MLLLVAGSQQPDPNGSATCFTKCSSPNEDLRTPDSKEPDVTEELPDGGGIILEYTTTTTVRLYSMFK